MQRHEFNLTAMLIGLLFAGLGAYALVVGPDHLQHALKWIWPITLLGLGSALLASSSGREHRARDEIRAERGEDGEVEQAGRSHDR